MQLRNILLGMVVAVGASLLPVGNAQALPAGWTDAGCFGPDRLVVGPNGSYIIYRNSPSCA